MFPTEYSIGLDSGCWFKSQTQSGVGLLVHYTCLRVMVACYAGESDLTQTNYNDDDYNDYNESIDR